MTTPNTEETPARYTQRGFRIYAEISDVYRSTVRVQKSSLASKPCVWIFCENDDLMRLSAGEPPAPHLDIAHAQVIRDALDEFIREHSPASSAEQDDQEAGRG